MDVEVRLKLDNEPPCHSSDQRSRNLRSMSVRTSVQSRPARGFTVYDAKRSRMICRCHSGTGTCSAVAAIRSQRDCTKSICSSTERSSNPGGGVGTILDRRELLRGEVYRKPKVKKSGQGWRELFQKSAPFVLPQTHPIPLRSLSKLHLAGNGNLHSLNKPECPRYFGIRARSGSKGSARVSFHPFHRARSASKKDGLAAPLCR